MVFPPNAIPAGANVQPWPNTWDPSQSPSMSPGPVPPMPFRQPQRSQLAGAFPQGIPGTMPPQQQPMQQMGPSPNPMMMQQIPNPMAMGSMQGMTGYPAGFPQGQMPGGFNAGMAPQMPNQMPNFSGGFAGGMPQGMPRGFPQGMQGTAPQVAPRNPFRGQSPRTTLGLGGHFGSGPQASPGGGSNGYTGPGGGGHPSSVPGFAGSRPGGVPGSPVGGRIGDPGVGYGAGLTRPTQNQNGFPVRTPQRTAPPNQTPTSPLPFVQPQNNSAADAFIGNRMDQPDNLLEAMLVDQAQQQRDAFENNRQRANYLTRNYAQREADGAARDRALYNDINQGYSARQGALNDFNRSRTSQILGNQGERQNRLLSGYDRARQNQLGVQRQQQDNLNQGFDTRTGNVLESQRGGGQRIDDRYGNLLSTGMGLTSLMGREAAERINESADRRQARTQQSRVNRGLANTTIAGLQDRGINADRDRELRNLDETVLRQRLGTLGQFGLPGAAALERQTNRGTDLMADMSGQALGARERGNERYDANLGNWYQNQLNASERGDAQAMGLQTGLSSDHLQSVDNANLQALQAQQMQGNRLIDNTDQRTGDTNRFVERINANYPNNIDALALALGRAGGAGGGGLPAGGFMARRPAVNDPFNAYGGIMNMFGNAANMGFFNALNNGFMGNIHGGGAFGGGQQQIVGGTGPQLVDGMVPPGAGDFRSDVARLPDGPIDRGERVGILPVDRGERPPEPRGGSPKRRRLTPQEEILSRHGLAPDGGLWIPQA